MISMEKEQEQVSDISILGVQHDGATCVCDYLPMNFDDYENVDSFTFDLPKARLAKNCRLLPPIPTCKTRQPKNQTTKKPHQ
jgi:hypothetical protein